jgi:ferredoxin
MQNQSDTKEVTGSIFNIQHFSVHDGPGIRTLVFLKGCPLSCIWCSNPESQAFYPEVLVNSARCIGCGNCIKACQSGSAKARQAGDKNANLLCKRCWKCVESCNTLAFTLVGTQMTAKEVLESKSEISELPSTHITESMSAVDLNSKSFEESLLDVIKKFDKPNYGIIMPVLHKGKKSNLKQEDIEIEGSAIIIFALRFVSASLSKRSK